MDRRGSLTLAFRRHSPTVHGQVIGLTMIMVPAITSAIPLDDPLHSTVQVLAAVVGFAGAVVVFGGMIERAFLQPTQPGPGSADPAPATTHPGDAPRSDASLFDDTAQPDEADAAEDQIELSSLDDGLRTVPHARAVWVGLLLLCLAFAVGAGWCLALTVTRGWQQYLPDSVMLALPAALLLWVTWRARLLRTAA